MADFREVISCADSEVGSCLNSEYLYILSTATTTMGDMEYTDFTMTEFVPNTIEVIGNLKKIESK